MGYASERLFAFKQRTTQAKQGLIESMREKDHYSRE
jgi:hypothetical protein